MKMNVFFVFSFILLFLNMSFIHSSDISNMGDSLQSNLNQAEEISHSLSNQETRSEYLRTQFIDVMNKTSFGRAVLEFEVSAKKYDTIFISVLGVEFSYSLLFFTTLFFFFYFIIFFYKCLNGLVVLSVILYINVSNGFKRNYEKIYNFIQNPSVFRKKYLHITIFALILFILITTHLPMGMATLLSGIFSEVNSWATKLIYFLICVLVYYLLSSMGKIFKNYYHNFKREVKDAELDNLVEKHKAPAERKPSSEGGTGESEEEILGREYLKALGEVIKEDE